MDSMRKGQDLMAEFPGLVIFHQKIPGREVGRHQHDDHEFFMPLQGEITLRFGDKQICGGSGRLVYAPPDLDHSFSSAPSGEGERVIFLIKKNLWQKNGGGKFPPSAAPASSLVRELIFFLLLNPKTKGASTFILALVNALSEHLSAMSGNLATSAASVHLSGKVQDKRVKQAVEMLQRVDEQPSMSALAAHSGLSVRNFNRLFLEETGMTPKHYATLLKVEKAKALLKKSQMTITDIALEVGYHSLSKFISTFQRYTGKLPSDYREVNS